MQIVFQSYISDGPGYTGSVVLELAGNRLTQTLQGHAPVHRLLPYHVGEIAKVEDATTSDAEVIWRCIGAEDREYIGDPANIDYDRVKLLTLSDGDRAIVILFGEPNLVGIAIDGQENQLFDVDSMPSHETG